MTYPHCYLEHLAPELLLPILLRLPDLGSLDSLLRASPAAYHLFDIQSATVFESVLSSGSTHKYSCALIRIIALIRANALPPTVHDLVSFRDMVRHETSPHRWEPPRWVHPPASLPLEISSTVLRGLLATNRKVQRLTFGCLEYYLDIFRSLRPSNSAGFSYDSRSFADIDSDLIGPWQEKPANALYYYPVCDAGPPSWLEQQRVLRAFWRVQLSQDLNAAVDASCIVWPEEEHDEDFEEDDEEEGFEGPHQTSPAELCDVPLYFWDDAGGRLVDDSELITRETLLEHELLESAIEYMQKTKELINEPIYWQLQKKWAAGSTPASPEDWKLLDLTFRSNMWSYFYNLTGSCEDHQRNFSSPLQHVKFEPFRRLGFCIWSTARMAGYGLLLPRDEYAVGMHAPFYEAWRSLLTEDERDAVDRENMERDAQFLAICEAAGQR